MQYNHYYKHLGVDKKAKEADIKKAYRKMARKACGQAKRIDAPKT